MRNFTGCLLSQILITTVMSNARYLPLLLLPFFLLSAGCSNKKKGAEENKTKGKILTVNGIVVTPVEMENKIFTTGSIIANEEVEIRSEIQGMIRNINFTEGGAVAKGQVLVKIDDREIQAQLKKLRLSEKEAKDDVYRKKKLMELNAVSQEEYDKALNQLGIIQTDIDLSLSTLEHTEITAPFNGVIGLRFISPGGIITPSTLVARLQQTDPVKIDFSIPEKYRLKIKKGSTILFELDGVDTLFQALVYAIESKVDPSTRNIPIRAICSNPGNLLVPGAFAKVQVLLEKIPDALVVPSQAVIPQIDGEKVFLVKNGKVKSQMIVSGIRTDREVQAEKGLDQNDTVITTGLLQVKDGMEVKVKIQPVK